MKFGNTNDATPSPYQFTTTTDSRVEYLAVATQLPQTWEQQRQTACDTMVNLYWRKLSVPFRWVTPP